VLLQKKKENVYKEQTNLKYLRIHLRCDLSTEESVFEINCSENDVLIGQG
jgi:hypothetical protein